MTAGDRLAVAGLSLATAVWRHGAEESRLKPVAAMALLLAATAEFVCPADNWCRS